MRKNVWSPGLLRPVVLAATCIATARALGAVVAIDASVSTAAQELIDGQPASINADEDTRNANGSNLPLLASADVVSTDLGGALAAQGQGFAVFADPTRLNQPNPEEFALEAACFSNAETVSYLVTASSRETRTLVFSQSEIAFASDGTREVESSVFLSGAVVMWSATPGADLNGLSGEIGLMVSRGGVEAPLFQTNLKLNGDGRGGVASQTDGPIQLETIGLGELAARGVDEATIRILRQVADRGVLIVLVIPLQEHVYRYVARADQSFELTAKLQARIRNAPNGTGVAVAVGRPFSELADFIQQGLPGAKGELVERAVNDAVAARGGLAPPAESSSPAIRRPVSCGALGGEALLMLGAVLSVGLTFRRMAASCRRQCG